MGFAPGVVQRFCTTWVWLTQMGIGASAQIVDALTKDIGECTAGFDPLHFLFFGKNDGGQENAHKHNISRPHHT